ncbi:MAG TPA: F0F1 ATP synthase subunit B, partial [Candidatus Dormibacteraeota bacterium]|nr:F0F1 ATP synthase subunit B [Candidatus Dormibacteraeota bacterium]
VEAGKRQVQFEQKQAMEELRRHVADLAIQAAERLIARSLDDTKQRELLDDYVRGLTAVRQGETPR